MPETEEVRQESPENANPVEQTPVIVDPDIEALARAFKLKSRQEEAEPEKEVVEEKKPEQEAPLEGTEPPKGEDEEPELDHKTKSWLGRVVAKQMKEKTDPLLAKIAELEGELRLAKEVKPEPHSEPEPEIDLNDPVYTKADVIALLDKRKEVDPDLKAVREMREKQEYQSNYVVSLRQMFRDTSDRYDPDVQEQIAKVLDNVLKNPKSHSDPSISAKLNFYEAVATVMSTAAPKKEQPPVPGNGATPPISPTGLPTGSKTTPSKTSTVVLDADAKRLQRAFGLSDEWIQKKLGQGK